EDGIRDLIVTGVQTCALPIFSPLPLDKGRSVFCGPFRRLTAPRCYLAVCPRELGLSSAYHCIQHAATITPYRHPTGKLPVPEGRSEERRVGKECRSGRGPIQR